MRFSESPAPGSSTIRRPARQFQAARTRAERSTALPHRGAFEQPLGERVGCALCAPDRGHGDLPGRPTSAAQSWPRANLFAPPDDYPTTMLEDFGRSVTDDDLARAVWRGREDAE